VRFRSQNCLLRGTAPTFAPHLRTFGG